MKYYESPGCFAFLPLVVELAAHKMKSNMHLHVEYEHNTRDEIEFYCQGKKLSYTPDKYLELIRDIGAGLLNNWPAQE